jgi:hypothetical protein
VGQGCHRNHTEEEMREKLNKMKRKYLVRDFQYFSSFYDQVCTGIGHAKPTLTLGQENMGPLKFLITKQMIKQSSQHTQELK